MTMIYTDFHSNPVLLLNFISSYIENYIYIGVMLCLIFVYMYVIELVLRMDTISWQIAVHHYTVILVTMIAQISIRNNSSQDLLGQLVVLDCVMIIILYAAFDFIPHIGLLCRRLNDGYHDTGLTHQHHGWRYACKQLEHLFHLLSCTVIPLVRTGIIVITVIYYVRVYSQMSYFIQGRSYLLASWVVIHMILITLLYCTQWYGTYVIYKHLYQKSIKDQQNAKFSRPASLARTLSLVRPLSFVFNQSFTSKSNVQIDIDDNPRDADDTSERCSCHHTSIQSVTLTELPTTPTVACLPFHDNGNNNNQNHNLHE